MKVYTVTFDQFNASLLNKTIYFFQIKKKCDPKTFEWYCVHKEVHLNQDRTLQNVKKSRKNNYSFSDIRALSHGLDIFSNIQ